MQPSEEKRLAEIRARTAALKAARESAPPPPAQPKVPRTLWYDDVLAAVRDLHMLHFTLEDMYGYADEFERKHPDAGDVQAAIRHTMQQLRDDGILFFHMNGTYTNLEIERAL
jgi:hypothetical protein